jgi:hypothetical protein
MITLTESALIERKIEMSEADSNWKSLYKIGGIAALIFVVYALVTMILIIVVGGQPESAAEAFKLLQENRIIGLLRLDTLTLLIVPLYYPIFLSIYIALKKSQIAYATLAALLAFAGATLFLATPSVFSWITLSDKYAVATSAAQKVQLLAAGETILASDMWHGSGAVIGGILILIAALIFSIVMLKSEDFGKGTAYVGIVSHGLDLVRIFLGFFIPQASVILMAIAGPLYLVWFPLLARDFFRLHRIGLSES